MARTLRANVWREDDEYIARCVEVPATSQGESEEEAVRMLKEALELYFSEPFPGNVPELQATEAKS